MNVELELLWPSFIRPWYWRLPFAVAEVALVWAPFLFLRVMASRTMLWITEHYGPFAPGRGYWMVTRDANGKRHLVPNPGMPPLPE